MSAGLLTHAVDFIDALLEDWYPGLGAREGNTTIESIPYVNRVIPCPYCVNGAVVCDPIEEREGREASPPSPHPPSRNRTSLSPSPAPREVKFSPGTTPPQPPTFFIESSQENRSKSPDYSTSDYSDLDFTSSIGRHRQRSINISSSSRRPGSPSVPLPVPRKPRLPSSHSHEGTPTTGRGRSYEGRGSEGQAGERRGRERSLSSPQGRIRDVLLPHRHDSKSQGNLIEYATEVTVTAPVQRLTSSDDQNLVQASKFGFMIESCILAARNGTDLICPAHKTHPLPVRDLAPDVVFADLPTQFLLDTNCVDRGVYVDHGTFGDIYRGTVFPTPSSTDDEGREVALKIDRLDSKKCTPETATKSYIEVRAEVSLLHKLHHPHVIDFIGVVLQPLCFILEWACGGSLHSLLTKYRKVDARIGPRALQQTALQVARGLSYLHYHKVVYYDLKSPNVLVFQFPTPQQSMQMAAHQLSPDDVPPIYLKIADLGISRIMSPGGTMGFKGSPGFMAPEILKYVGLEAVTEKVDIYSFGMFMYELISLHFPFEKQNLMSSQIEKLVIDGERPPLQNRELSNPILYLDIMRWCWQQDYRNRPSSEQLIEVLSNESVPCLMEAVSLHGSSDITSSALCIVPIEHSHSEEGEYGAMSSLVSPSTSHQFVARGDLQEDVWLGLYSGDVRKRGGGDGVEKEGKSHVCVINFKGKASFSTQMIPVSNARVTAMCCVVDTMWVGTEEGELFLFDAITKNEILTRLLALLPGQSISSITHLTTLRQVLVTRSDGCVLLFDEGTQEHKLPDDSRYDNRLNGTQLPVRSFFRTPEKLPIFATQIVRGKSEDLKTVWCGSSYEMALLIDVGSTGMGYCRKCHCRPRNDITPDDHVTDLTLMERDGEDGEEEEGVVWMLTQPDNCIYCWSTEKERLLLRVDCSLYSSSPVTSICSIETTLHVAQSNGQVLQLHTPHRDIESVSLLRGHVKSVHCLLTLGARVLPRHWRPNILGRSNVMDYLMELLGEEDLRDINDSMVGRQTRLLVSVGKGFYGIAGRVVEALMSPSDISDNFLLLWSL